MGLLGVIFMQFSLAISSIPLHSAFSLRTSSLNYFKLSIGSLILGFFMAFSRGEDIWSLDQD